MIRVMEVYANDCQERSLHTYLYKHSPGIVHSFFPTPYLPALADIAQLFSSASFFVFLTSLPFFFWFLPLLLPPFSPSLLLLLSLSFSSSFFSSLRSGIQRHGSVYLRFLLAAETSTARPLPAVLKAVLLPLLFHLLRSLLLLLVVLLLMKRGSGEAG